MSLSLMAIVDFVANVNSVHTAFVNLPRAVIYNKGSWERPKSLRSLQGSFL